VWSVCAGPIMSVLGRGVGVPSVYTKIEFCIRDLDQEHRLEKLTSL